MELRCSRLGLLDWMWGVGRLMSDVCCSSQARRLAGDFPLGIILHQIVYVRPRPTATSERRSLLNSSPPRLRPPSKMNEIERNPKARTAGQGEHLAYPKGESRALRSWSDLSLREDVPHRFMARRGHAGGADLLSTKKQKGACTVPVAASPGRRSQEGGAFESPRRRMYRSDAGTFRICTGRDRQLQRHDLREGEYLSSWVRKKSPVELFRVFDRSLLRAMSPL